VCVCMDVGWMIMISIWFDLIRFDSIRFDSILSLSLSYSPVEIDRVLSEVKWSEVSGHRRDIICNNHDKNEMKYEIWNELTVDLDFASLALSLSLCFERTYLLFPFFSRSLSLSLSLLTDKPFVLFYLSFSWK
jgi:hypothetical protein